MDAVAMSVAVYTLTRDRLDYTKHCFDLLKRCSGYPYDHYVLDNGSEDGTVGWLLENQDSYADLVFSKSNLGISAGSNRILDRIGPKYDLIIKMDNDCEVISENIIGQIVEVYQGRLPYDPQYVLSPRVEGIRNQPARLSYFSRAGRRIGHVGIVGGLFHVVPGSVYANYRYPENLPLAKGQDDHFCDWFNKQGGVIGYIEGLSVAHYETTEGQAARYPEYFKRKWKEELA